MRILLKSAWDWLKFGLLILALIAFFFAPLFLSIGVWKECRAEGHSFWYCFHLISK